MDLTINNFNYRKNVYQMPAFKGEADDLSIKVQNNLNKLTHYFKTNADVYFKPIYESKTSGDDIIGLSVFDYERTEAFLEVVKKHIREQIIQKGYVNYEDEYLTDLSKIRGALEIDKLTPEGFSDLIDIAAKRDKKTPLNVYKAIEAMNTYDNLKNFKTVPFEYFLYGVKQNLEKKDNLLTKEEVMKLDKNSDLFKFDFVNDLANANSRDEMLNKFKNEPYKNHTIFINTPLLMLGAGMAYMKKENDGLANRMYDEISEEQDNELFISHKNCEKLTEKIQNEFNVRIAPIPEEDYIPQVFEDVFQDTYDELSAWENASEGQCIHLYSIDYNDFDTDIIRRELREKMTYYNETKNGENYVLTNNFGLSNKKALDKIFDEKIYREEFENAGIPDDLIKKAYESPTDFIMVASRGNFSDYSDEFKQVLIDFGMPEWELKLEDI